MHGETFEELLRSVDTNSTSKRHRKIHKEMAEKDFADHVIVEKQPGVFRCAKPGTSYYSFWVAFLPHSMIVVYGDVGEMMVQRGGEDWLSGAIRHDYVSDYVFEKVRPVRRWQHKEFFPGDALAEIKRLHDGVPLIEDGKNLVEEAKEEGLDLTSDAYDYWEDPPHPEQARKIAEAWLSWDESGQDADAWSRAYYEHTGDCEYPDCRDYSSNDMWCYQALSWFVRARQKEEVTA